jgi:hypothetical protein
MMHPRGAIAMALSVVLSHCVGLSVKDRDWAFMQSVGGMAVTSARGPDGRRHLAVECDVSGVREISVKPTAINSGIVAHEVRVRRSGAALYLIVRTAIPSPGRTSACDAVSLGVPPAGRYDVYYGNPPGWFTKGTPVKIGEVEVDA